MRKTCKIRKTTNWIKVSTTVKEEKTNFRLIRRWVLSNRELQKEKSLRKKSRNWMTYLGNSEMRINISIPTAKRWVPNLDLTLEMASLIQNLLRLMKTLKALSRDRKTTNQKLKTQWTKLLSCHQTLIAKIKKLRTHLTLTAVHAMTTPIKDSSWIISNSITIWICKRTVNRKKRFIIALWNSMLVFRKNWPLRVQKTCSSKKTTTWSSWMTEILNKVHH